MRVVIAGAHGKIGLLLGRQLTARGDSVAGIIRNTGHSADLEAIGVEPAVLDLESSPVDEVAKTLNGADAVVFSAGAGPGSSAERKDTVDRAASVLLADAAAAGGVQRFVQVSAMGVESVRGSDASQAPEGGEIFHAYLLAKLAAEEDLRTRSLDWTILRPGGLTDDPGVGTVRLEPSVPRGSVSRADVAGVLVALLDTPASAGEVLELIGGDIPINEAVQAAILPNPA